MKNKKIFIGIGIIMLLLICFVCYKGFLLYYFNHSDKEYKEMFNKVTDLSINRNITNQNDSVDRLRYYIPSELNLTLKNSSNGQKIYTKIDNEGKQVGQLIIGLANINSLEDTKQSLKFVNYEKLAKKYNINDEIDLYHYYYEHKEEKRNIFWDSERIKMKGFVNLYMLMVSSGNSTCNRYFLTQDMKGYMVDCSNSNDYDAYFVYEDKMYVVSYMSNVKTTMTYQEFIKILESISFE